MRAATVCRLTLSAAIGIAAAGAAFAGGMPPGRSLEPAAKPAEPPMTEAVRPVSALANVPVRIAGRIHHTLYQAAREAGLSKSMTRALIGLFARQVDYRQDIHAGDRFVVVYQPNDADPTIAAAELDLNDTTLRAFRYTDGDGNPAYYTLHGKPLKPTLLRTPLDYTRVSSPFSLRRLNPVLHIYRPHYGVDLAAPAGTPIHAAGPGRVTFRGRDGGYGNLIIIDNPGPYSTRYGHMSRFAKGIHVGSHVKQGEVIGYVGSTGLATGPHLHFEIRVNGKPEPPLKVPLPREALSEAQLMAYENEITPLLEDLDPTPLRPTGGAVADNDPPAALPAFLPSDGKPAPLCVVQPPSDTILALLGE